MYKIREFFPWFLWFIYLVYFIATLLILYYSWQPNFHIPGLHSFRSWDYPVYFIENALNFWLLIQKMKCYENWEMAEYYNKRFVLCRICFLSSMMRVVDLCKWLTDLKVKRKRITLLLFLKCVIEFFSIKNVKMLNFFMTQIHVSLIQLNLLHSII